MYLFFQIALFAIVATTAAKSEPWLGYGGLGLGWAGAHRFGGPFIGGAAALPAAAIPASGLVSTASVRASPGALSTSQFRKEDEFGNQAFGYDNVNTARSEGGNPALGVVSGSYTNKATGITVNYVADAAGFRIVPGRKKRSIPATKFIIKYNPGHAVGYQVIPHFGYGH